jgi:DNA ligase-1
MLLAPLAQLSNELAGTAARGAKTKRLAELLAQCGPDEITVVVSWLSGELTQRQIGVGYASLRARARPSAAPSLTVMQTEEAFEELGRQSGAGSQGRRQQLLQQLFERATETEQAFIARVITGELRQGALIGVMADAIATAAGVPLATVRRAAMLSGSLPAVATAALTGGSQALASFTLQVGRPIGPMLAQTAASTADALAELGTAAFEWKLDGVRVQLHKAGNEVRIFTRTLDDITARLPDVAAAVRSLPADRLVADAEAIALRPDGRPLAFQDTAARLASRTSRPQVPLTTYLFDLLHVDGRDLLDEPTETRFAALSSLVGTDGEIRQVPRLVTADPLQAQAFLDGALEHGHEGVVAKSLTQPYQAGRRGAGWLKIKPVHTLDLVVLAVEWGSGRRTGKLSNIHLGARASDDDGEDFVMLGKTFKGMTDAMLAWQTQRFLSLAEGPTDGYVVRVRPVQVVEIAFDGVQRSSRYPGGVTLRFARVLRYREDKTASEADTLETVKSFSPA